MMQHSTMVATAALAHPSSTKPHNLRKSTSSPTRYAAPSMFDFDETSALIKSAYASSVAWFREQAVQTDFEGGPRSLESVRRCLVAP